MIIDKDQKIEINKEINYSSNIQKDIFKESASKKKKIIKDLNLANYEENEFKEEKKLEDLNYIDNFQINHLSKNINKINDFTNIPKEENSEKSKIIFNMPINDIRKEIKKDEDTDFTSKDYFEEFVDDYIFEDYEENEKKEVEKPIFYIPIDSIKKQSKNY